MSLTSHLDRRHSRLREWFEETLPNVRPVQRAWRAAGAPTIRPAGANPPYGYLGAAFDYRLRYYLAAMPTSSLIAGLGAGALRPRRGDNPVSTTGAGRIRTDSYSMLTAGLDAFLAANAPLGRLLPLVEERVLVSYCYVLSLYEALYRASFDPQRSPLATLAAGATAQQQLAVVPDDAIDNLSP